MKAPGSRYDDPVLRKDLQVDHMAKLWTKEGDHGGEHINSGYSWKTVGVGPFWYYVMTQSGLQPSATFQDFANVLMKAAKSFGSSKLQRAMKQAWADVGVDV